MTELVISKSFAKAALIHALLLSDETVGLMIDHHYPGVVMPDSLRAVEPPGGAYVFLYNLNFANPIPRIALDEDGVRAVLSVRGMSSETFVPWAAVFTVLSDTRGAISVDTLPERVAKLQTELRVAAEAATAELAAVQGLINGTGGSA